MTGPKKFMEIKSGTDESVKNQWLESCRKNGIPCVIVTSKGALSDVAWDYITYPMGCEKLFQQNDEYLNKGFLRIYSNYGSGKSKFTISSATVDFYGLPAEHAKSSASDIFDLVNDVVKKQGAISGS